MIKSGLLLHPEILSRQLLIQILEERQVKLTQRQHATKQLLVEIFHCVVTPLPQQQITRLNRRGRYIRKKLKRTDGKRRNSEDGRKRNHQSEHDSEYKEKLPSKRTPTELKHDVEEKVHHHKKNHKKHKRKRSSSEEDSTDSEEEKKKRKKHKKKKTHHDMSREEHNHSEKERTEHRDEKRHSTYASDEGRCSERDYIERREEHKHKARDRKLSSSSDYSKDDQRRSGHGRDYDDKSRHKVKEVYRERSCERDGYREKHKHKYRDRDRR
ncbi:uncharacterized protein [Amphiura filiformis]|uniref:uncharacterized protein n=1 Tax=Amphiura filiformis TaxID=82378 RepID=UPI003B215FF8